jgi:RNA polymerase sigma-70 factor (ECF subfamily)
VTSPPDPHSAPGAGAPEERGERFDFAGLRAPLLAMALHRLGDLAAAEDAVQETLARVLEAAARGRVIDDPVRFAHGVARNVIADRLRAEHRHPHLAADALDLPAPALDPLEALVDAEARWRVRRAVDGLSPEEVELLRLVYEEGMPLVEIAPLLGKTNAAVRKQVQRLRDRLRPLLREEPGGRESRSGGS